MFEPHGQAPNCSANCAPWDDAAARVSVRRLTARVIDTQGRTASPLGSPSGAVQ